MSNPRYELHKEKLAHFYQKHDPMKIRHIDLFLAKVDTNTLNNQLLVKYGESPGLDSELYTRRLEGVRTSSRVRAQRGGSEGYYPASVTAINSDGTYNLMFDDGAVEHNARPSLLEIDSGPSPQRTQGSNQERILELQQRLASTKAETDRMRGQVSDISSDGAFQQAHGPNHNMQTPQRQGPAMEYQVQSLQKELDSAHKMHDPQFSKFSDSHI